MLLLFVAGVVLSSSFVLASSRCSNFFCGWELLDDRPVEETVVDSINMEPTPWFLFFSDTNTTFDPEYVEFLYVETSSSRYKSELGDEWIQLGFTQQTVDSSSRVWKGYIAPGHKGTLEYRYEGTEELVHQNAYERYYCPIHEEIIRVTWLQQTIGREIRWMTTNWTEQPI